MFKFECLYIKTHNDGCGTKWLILCYSYKSVLFTKYYFEFSGILNHLHHVYNENTTFYTHNLDVLGGVLLKEIVCYGLKFNWVCRGNKIYNIKIFIGSIILDFKCFNKFISLEFNQLLFLFTNKTLDVFPQFILHPLTLKSKFVKLLPNHFENYSDYKKYGLLNLPYIVDPIKITSDYFCKSLGYFKEAVSVFLDFCKDYFKMKSLRCNSLSSIAFDYFKNNFGGIEIGLSANIDMYLRQSYYGGRCEVFGNLLTSEKALHFDFKGMYSLCMLEDLPSGEYKIEHLHSISKPGFYKIRFYSDMEYPILPYKSKGLGFYNGVFEGIY